MKLHCQYLGESGDALVLLHGLFGQGGNLGAAARALSGRFRCLLPDQRNHGRSPHDPRMDYRLMADDLRQLLDREGIDRCHLLGHSMGGKVAMQFALDHPQRALSLLVADIAPVAYPPHHEATLAALQAVRAAGAGSRREAQRILDRATRDAAVSAFLLSNWTRRDDGSYDWRFNLDALETNAARLAAAPVGGSYPGAVLFIKGERSDYLDAAYRGATLRHFPTARLKVIAGAGHWPHAEKPAVFNRLADDFFTACADRGAGTEC
jgi:esterase